MSNIIRIKRSSTHGKIPTTAQLAQGELAVNLSDLRLYTKDTADEVVQLNHCRAWVNFNGTGTVAIRGSYNVSSITDYSPGSYRINCTSAMPDANFSALSMCNSVGGFSVNVTTCSDYDVNGFGLRVTPVAETPTERDATIISAAIFR